MIIFPNDGKKINDLIEIGKDKVNDVLKMDEGNYNCFLERTEDDRFLNVTFLWRNNGPNDGETFYGKLNNIKDSEGKMNRIGDSDLYYISYRVRNLYCDIAFIEKRFIISSVKTRVIPLRLNKIKPNFA